MSTPQMLSLMNLIFSKKQRIAFLTHLVGELSEFFFYLDERGEGHLLDEELPLEVEEEEVHPTHLRHWALSWLAVALIETFTSREKTERKN